MAAPATDPNAGLAEQRQVESPAGYRCTCWFPTISVGHWLLLPVLLLAGVLRAQELSTMGVSFDESFTQRMVEFSWREMFDRIGRETQPPLFYVVLKLWNGLFGGTAIAGRILTVSLGVAAVVGMYAFVRTAYRRKERPPLGNFTESDLPALVAATLLAVAPLQIFWDQQIRMYSLPIALSLWSSFFLVHALTGRVSQFRNWSVYTTMALLLAYSHYFGLFVLVSQFVYASAYQLTIGRGHWFDRISPVLLSGCLLSLAWQPWLAVFLKQRSGVAQGFYLPEPSWTVFGRTMHELWVGVGVPLTAGSGLLIAEASFLVLAVLVLGRRPADLLVIASAIVPVAAAFVISSISHPIITARYFLFSHVFVLAAIAIVVCRIPRFGRYMAIVFIFCGLSKPCWDYLQWRNDAASLPGMQAAVARIEGARGTSPLIVSNPMLYTSVLTYIGDRGSVYNFRPPGGFPMYQGTPVMREEDYVDSKWLRETEARDIWTLGGSGSMGHVPVPADWSLVQEERYQEWFTELVVRLYTRNGRDDPGA